MDGRSDVGYSRGVRTSEVDARRVARIALAVALVGLGTLAVALFVSAARQSSRLDELRQHGVAVTAEVTGCQAISSGVGMGIEYWQCQGSYRLGGHRYDAAIGGSRAFLEAGRTIAAVAVPGKPSLLSTPGAVAKGPSRWGSYGMPAVLGGLVLMTALGWLGWSALRRGRDGQCRRDPLLLQ